jgi:hypothetical protein
MSVDGIDCQIPERGPEFSSHKFAMKSALRYEVDLNIQTGDICWINGAFPAGKYGDLEIFGSALMSYLKDFERVEADDGYIGEAPEKVRCPMCITVPNERKRMMSIVC